MPKRDKDKKKIKNVKQVESAPSGRHSLGGGLILDVGKARRSWVLRVQHRGRRIDVGLGPYPYVGLAEAKQKAIDLRYRARRGIDVLAEKHQPVKVLPTFREIAALVIEEAKAKSTNEKVRYQWERHLGEAYSGPLLSRPVNEITTLEIRAVLAPIWSAKPEVARKVYPAIRRVFDRARIVLRDQHGIDMPHNPANWTDLKASGLEKPKELTRGNHPALAFSAMPAFVSALRQRRATAARALEFLILTGVRTAAVLGAKWDQFDLAEATWTVPLELLKDRAHRTMPFVVPLAPRAAEILAEMKELGATYVFAGQSLHAPMSNMSMLTLLKRMNSGATRQWVDPADKRPITAHGFRATFKTWAEERTPFPRGVIETALGHAVGGKVEASYMRGSLLEKRRELMTAWASHCEPGTPANVVQLHRGAAA